MSPDRDRRNYVDNTAARDLLDHYAEALAAGDGGRAIQNSERRGQLQLVDSDVLPRVSPAMQDELRGLGFTIGADIADDPLFCEATDPDGWTRKAAATDRLVLILDQHKRPRVQLWYKAAHYDRRADLTILSLAAYLDAVDAGEAPLVFDAWATREAVRTIIAGRPNPGPL